MKVIAVVVTYNRSQLLKRNIACLRKNSPHAIIVVNNGSTDDTGEWLAEQTDLIVITQANVGRFRRILYRYPASYGKRSRLDMVYG